MKVKKLVTALALAALTVVPLAGPAQATHSCGWEGPCPHAEDIITILCDQPAAAKYLWKVCQGY
jgi:hypothetical protein